MSDYVHNHALQASLRVCHVSDMIKQMEAKNRMSPALPYTARCLTLFNPLWEGEGGGGRGRGKLVFYAVRHSLPDLGPVGVTYCVSFPASPLAVLTGEVEANPPHLA